MTTKYERDHRAKTCISLCESRGPYEYVKESIEHTNGDIDQSKLDRLTTLDKLLNEKLALVKKLDDEILEECDNAT